jgi:hypothetical protein
MQSSRENVKLKSLLLCGSAFKKIMKFYDNFFKRKGFAEVLL